MARSGGGISRLLPHSLVSGRDVTDVLFRNPILHVLHALDGDDLHEVPEQSVQTSSMSRSVLYWQSGPASFCFVRARSAVPRQDGTAQSN